jgi:hypothetical protein
MTISLSALLGSIAPIGATGPAGSSGSVLQVVSVAKTDTFSTTSTTFTDVTNLSVTITPKFSSSKILIICQLTVSATAAVYSIHPRLMRNSTPIFVSDAAGSRQQAITMYEGAPASGVPIAINYLDSPATTSATTYKIQVRTNNSSYNAYVNRTVGDNDEAAFARGVSSITVMEIAV